jgi:AraC-like DNA-binding protein
MASIEAAIEAINSLEPGEPINYATIAKKFGVKRLTLSRRHRGVTSSKANQYKQ